MTDILTYEAHRNECRMARLRDHYTHTLTIREHTDLIERGEAIRREWHLSTIVRGDDMNAVAAAQPPSAPAQPPPLFEGWVNIHANGRVEIYATAAGARLWAREDMFRIAVPVREVPPTEETP